MMRFTVMSGGLLILLATVSSTRTEVSTGVGAGSYQHHYGCGGQMVVPYREAGIEVRHRNASGPEVGAHFSARDDEPGPSNGEGDETLAEGPRIMTGAWVGWDGTYFKGRAGIIFTDYHLPRAADNEGLVPMPRLSLGVGYDRAHLVVGVFDAPLLAASSEGGEPITSLRLALVPARDQQLTLGGTAHYGEGVFTATYSARFDNGLIVGAGGYVGEVSKGGYLTLGTELPGLDP